MLKSYEATLDHGQLQWQGEPPDVVKARIIVTVIEDQSLTRPRRKAPASIAGKGRTLGDLVESIVLDEDWECLK
jgi:hypothetical protein